MKIEILLVQSPGMQFKFWAEMISLLIPRVVNPARTVMFIAKPIWTDTPEIVVGHASKP